MIEWRLRWDVLETCRVLCVDKCLWRYLNCAENNKFMGTTTQLVPFSEY